MSSPGKLLRRMVDELTATGDLRPEWREAFLAVPRHAFVPDTVWREDEYTDERNNLIPLHRSEDPDAWLELAYADAYVITQVDDGHPAGPGLNGFEATSSASMPSMVASMLAALDIQRGMRVCEIGTGTGYNAALLAERLGAELVTTIEVDPQIAVRAEQALTESGYGAVTVITGDGARGYPPRAPYDRVLSTAACQRVPYSWIVQTQPGGRIVAPWCTAYYNGGLLSLTVAENGTALGNLVGMSSFMDLRDQRIPRASVGRCVYDEDKGAVTSTDLHPYDVAGHFDVNIAIGIQVPRCKRIYRPADGDSEEAILWFLDPWSRSWASLHHVPKVASEAYEVRQLGPRKLWDEVEAAYRRWVELGSPAADRLTFTVTREGQHVKLPEG